MLAELLKHPRALLISLALHAVVIGLIVFNFHFVDRPDLIKPGQVEKTVKAEVVDQQQLEAREKQKQAEEQRIKDEARKKKEAEAKRLAEKKRKEEEKKKGRTKTQKRSRREA